MFTPEVLQALVAGGGVGAILTAVVMAFKAYLVRSTEKEASRRDDFQVVRDGLLEQIHVLRANWETDSARKEKAIQKGKAELQECIDRCKHCEEQHEETKNELALMRQANIDAVSEVRALKKRVQNIEDEH